MSNLGTKTNQTLQISFVLHQVDGYHAGKQAAAVCINGSTFIVHPRSSQDTRNRYENGYTLFLPRTRDITATIAILSESIDGRYFVDAVTRASFTSSKNPKKVTLELAAPGGVYRISTTFLLIPISKERSGRQGSITKLSTARSRRRTQMSR